MPIDDNMGGYRTMAKIALEAIKEAILNGEYKPGTRLIPVRLEKELNLGRVAIREALRELTGVGLVANLPNKGAVVAKTLDIEEMREIFEIRYDLEGKACEMAAVKISEEEIQKLERLNRDMAGYGSNSKEYFLLNRKFHLDFYQASGRKFLCQIIGQVFDKVLVFRSIYPFAPEAIPAYVDDHTQLLAAAKARDGEKARQVIVRHLSAGFESFNAKLRL